MAIQTDSNLVSVDAILSAFVVFAAANGFTNETNTTIDSDTLYRLSRTTDSITTYWGFRNEAIVSSTLSDIGITSRMMRILPTSGNWTTLGDGQRRQSRTGFFDLSANYAGYTFYADGNNVFGVIELRTNLYTYLCIGDVDRIGAWFGGAYLNCTNALLTTGVWEPYQFPGGSSGTRNVTALFSVGAVLATGTYRNYVRYHLTNDITGNANQLDFMGLGSRDSSEENFGCSTAPPTSDTATNFSSSVTNTLCRVNVWGRVFSVSPSATTLRAPILSIFIFRQDTATGNRARCLGSIANVGAININILNPKDLVNTDWRIFSLGQKFGDATVAAVTGDHGFAFKEIP